MAFSDTLTIRNLSTKELIVEYLERFPPPKTKSLANFLLTLLPNNAKLSDSAQPFQSQQLGIRIPPFQTCKSNIKLVENSPGERTRIFFSCIDFKFRIDVNSESRLVALSGSEIDFYALWHQSHSHLTLLSTPLLNQWQVSLPDFVPLSALSIPGTHNSATCYRALPSVRCQAVRTSEQLENGIRFFDIRCNPDGENLTLIHGNFPISFTGAKYLKQILDEIYAFLDKNSSETVLVSLKREGPANVSDQEFSLILYEKFIKKDLHRWYISPLVPSLSQVRGKCVLLRRFHIHESLMHQNEGKGFGIDAEHWTYNTPNCTTSSGDVIVQDFCEVTANRDIEQKIHYVRDHLVRASQVTYSHGGMDSARKVPFYVNFLSASNFWRISCWPENIAAKLNPAIRRYLCTEHDVSNGDGGTGVVVCDFVGEKGDWDLSRLIVSMNVLLELRAARAQLEENKIGQEAIKQEQLMLDPEEARKEVGKN